MSEPGALTVPEFDRAAAAEAAAELIACCASRRWAEEMVQHRPYGSLRALLDAGERLAGELDFADVLEALDAHPRIGQQVAGSDRESAWSRQEQAGAGGLPPGIAEQLVAGNIAYETAFGHVFLICATGLSAAEILTDLQSRLGNDVALEQEVVRTELAKIVRVRLGKAFR